MVLGSSLTLAFLVAAFASAACTPVARRLAIHVGAIDQPGGRKIHGGPIPRLGGVAVFAAMLVGALVVGLLDPALRNDIPALGPQLLVIATATLLLLGVGIIDDIEPVTAWQKFAAETVAAFVVVQWAIPVTSVDLVVVTIPETLFPLPQLLAAFWIVAVANAFNMIDGLDGLASGIGAIAATALALASWHIGGEVQGILLAAAAGAFTGFLVHNGAPARIFLGDSGTLSMGFLLGCLSIMGMQTAGTWTAFPAMLALGVPLLDLGLAVARRGLTSVQLERVPGEQRRYGYRWSGVPGFFAPDSRHVHHRLLALGLSPRTAVLSLYAASSVVGILAVASVQWRQLAPYLVLLTAVVFAYVSSRWFYEELWIFKRGMLLPFFESRFARFRGVHLAYDVTTLLLAFTLASAVAGAPGGFWRAATAALATACVFWAARVYQASMRHAGVWELLGMGRALLYGVFVAVIVDVLLFGTHFSTGQWLLYAYFGLTATVGGRLSFRVLDAAYQRGREGSERVLIVGAGRGGVLMLRELLANREIGMAAAGFVDDDRTLWGRRIEGYPIHSGGLDALERVLRISGATAVVIAIRALTGERLEEIQRTAEVLGVRTYRLNLSVEPVTPMADVLRVEPLRPAINSSAPAEAPALIRLK